MAPRKKKAAATSGTGTNYKVLRTMFSQQLERQLHRGEVVALEEDSNIRNAVHLGYLSTTNEQPPAPAEEEEVEEDLDDTGE